MISTMNRRHFLTLGIGAIIAGCLGNRSPATDDDTARADSASGSIESAVPADPTNATTNGYSGPFELPAPEGELRQGAPIDAIPAITAPIFADN